MKITKKIKIGGRTFTIDYPYKFTEGEDEDGQSHLAYQTIRIREGVNDEYARVVLWHEIFELINDMHECGIFGEGEIKEQRISTLSEYMQQIETDNKNMFKD